jgi:hypothetical protein
MCERCGKNISERANGSELRAHKCEHGNECVSPSYIHPHDGRTHHVPCPECNRFEASAKVKQLADLDAGIMSLAFLIEDPCPADAVTLASALVEFGRAVPDGKRDDVASVVIQLTRILLK